MTALTLETASQPALRAASVAMKTCPECGEKFAAGGRGLGKTFCSAEHRQAFNARMKAEGAVMAAIVKAWHLTRHAKPGTDEADLCGFARTELAAIAKTLNDADRAAGRPSAAVYVQSLMDSGTLYCDRRRG